MARFSYTLTDSWLYRLNPLSKGFGALLFILIFSVPGSSPAKTLIFILFLTLTGITGKAPIGNCYKGLKSITLLLVVAGIAGIFQDPSRSLVSAMDPVLRICGIFLTAALFVSITPQNEMIFFWETIFSPLGFVGFSNRELALVMVIGIRFLPIFIDELDRIRMAQAARGARFNRAGEIFGNPVRMMPLLVPALVLSINKASELALTMEARGYRLSSPRSRYKTYPINSRDLCTLSFMALLTMAQFFI